MDFYFCLLVGITTILNLNPIFSLVLRNENDNKDMSSFITSLVQEKFSECTVLIVGDGNPEFFNLNELIKSLELTNTNMDLNSNLNSIVHNKGIHRFQPYCSVIITLMETMDSSFSDRFSHLVLSQTNRDEDHYIFVTKNQATANKILSSELSFKIRYKLAVFNPKFVDEENKQITMQVKTLCLYCKFMGRQGRIMNLDENNKQLMFPDFTKDFNGHRIKMTCPTKYKAMYEMERVNGFYRHKRGFHTIVFHAIQQALNLTYELKPCSGTKQVPEGASGTLLSNGTWAGCMGDVLSERADLSMSVSPDDKRILYVEFSSSIEYTWLTFTTRQPEAVHSWKSVFKAYRPSVWITIGLSAIGIGGLLILFQRILPSKFRPGKQAKSLTTGETSLAIFGPLVAQGQRAPSTIPAIIIYSTWIMSALILGTAYTSKLTSFITSPEAESVPKTFKDLIHSDYEFGASRAFRDGLGEEIFKRSSNKIMRRIYQKMSSDKNDIDCTTRVANSKYACFAWEVMQQFNFKTIFSDRTGHHPFSVADDTAFFVSMNYITRKKEIFRSHFNKVIDGAYNSGLIKKWIEMDWQNVKEERLRKNSSSTFKWARGNDGPKAFTLNNFQGAFCVLFVGIFVGFMSFFVEKFIKHIIRVFLLFDDQ